jgi:hypothetical protein
MAGWSNKALAIWRVRSVELATLAEVWQFWRLNAVNHFFMARMAVQ